MRIASKAAHNGQMQTSQSPQSEQLWELREDACGELISQHTSQADAMQAIYNIPREWRQEVTVWPHVMDQPDHLYKNGYGRDPKEQQAHIDAVQSIIALGKLPDHKTLLSLKTNG